MSALELPAIPGCGAPAIIRIEAYSPRKSLYGSLDGSVYACEQHAQPVANTLFGAGFTPYRMPASDVKRCGDGFDFLASKLLTAPDPGGTS